MLTAIVAATGGEGGLVVTEVLLDLLVILFAAKLGSELAERVGAPAVVGEILAGILVGPSALGLIGADAVLPVFAEVGVILLLLEVGLEMNLGELAKVGRSSMQVAVTGVVLPFAAGFVAMEVLGEGGNTSLFMGAALTATSVGITARVFGDLRALATPEARTVLGAAVADDVLGLVILTVVVRIVTEGSVSALSVLGIVGVAVAFLVVGGVVASVLAPAVFARVHKHARSSSSLLVLAVVFTLGMAELANQSKLAPIVGAFVAGLALTRSTHAERVRREIAPISHVFVPVFFVMIGVDSDISQFAKPKVLGIAGVLFVLGVVGKVLAGYAATGAVDKRLIGLGMIPRGEVGLIFAGIGLKEGVLGEDLYASLLLVVLATTLITPPLLSMRAKSMQRAVLAGGGSAEPPPGGWLSIGAEQVELVATPPDDLGVTIALAAAPHLVTRRPGDDLLRWLSAVPADALRWSSSDTGMLLEVLRRGSERSWRFLWTTGVLEAAMPELAKSIERRRSDPSNLDPGAVMRWTTVQLVQDELAFVQAGDDATAHLARPELAVLAALLIDVTAGDADANETTEAFLRRLALSAEETAEMRVLVEERDLLAAVARRYDALDESVITQLAVHLRSREAANASYVLTKAVGELDGVARQRLEEVRRFLVATIDELSDGWPHLIDVLETRRVRTNALLSGGRAADRVLAGSRQWLLSNQPEVLAAQARMLDPVPRPDEVRLVADAAARRVSVVSRDRPGLLAAVTAAFDAAGLEIEDASAATWPDGVALSTFTVSPGERIDEARVRALVTASFDEPLTAVAVTGASVSFDERSSPWYTVAFVEADDRAGLLHSITTAFAHSGVRIHAMRVSTVGGRARDSFEVTDARGAKLSPDHESRVRDALRAGADAFVTRRGRRNRISSDT